MQAKLVAAGLTTLCKLRDALNDDDWAKQLVKDTKGLSLKLAKLCKTIFVITPLVPGACPPKKDHRLADNPYLSRYPTPIPNPDPDGEEAWEKMVAKSQICKHFVSINRMIDHIFIESAKVFVGTEHADDYKVYHDALSLFVAKDSYDYMKLKGYYVHLIVPQNGLSRGTVYAFRMVGMRPEVMPLDAHLNQDLHENVDRHVNLTSHLPDDHPNKFSKRTPKHLAYAYKRIWNPALGPHGGAPSSKRIREDIERVVNKTYLKIFERRGRVLDTAAYTGRRAVEQQERFAEQWGGKRIKGEGPVRKYWVHPSVKQYEATMMEACRRGHAVDGDRNEE